MTYLAFKFVLVNAAYGEKVYVQLQRVLLQYINLYNLVYSDDEKKGFHEQNSQYYKNTSTPTNSNNNNNYQNSGGFQEGNFGGGQGGGGGHRNFSPTRGGFRGQQRGNWPNRDQNEKFNIEPDFDNQSEPDFNMRNGEEPRGMDDRGQNWGPAQGRDRGHGNFKDFNNFDEGDQVNWNRPNNWQDRGRGGGDYRGGRGRNDNRDRGGGGRDRGGGRKDWRNDNNSWGNRGGNFNNNNQNDNWKDDDRDFGGHGGRDSPWRGRGRGFRGGGDFPWRGRGGGRGDFQKGRGGGDFRRGRGHRDGQEGREGLESPVWDKFFI